MKTSYKIWTNNVISEKKKDKEKKNSENTATGSLLRRLIWTSMQYNHK